MNVRRPLLLLAVALLPGSAHGQTPDSLRVPGPLMNPGGCESCHGELELLRQRASSLDSARALHVSSATLGASAHDTLACADCHSGFGSYPHRPRGSTTSCGGCHQEEEGRWAAGVHGPGDGQPTDCAACHGVHDVSSAARLAEAAGVRRLNGACGACHDPALLPTTDPHSDTVSCAGCHAPHDTRRAADPDSRVAPMRQYETCGSCHEEPADSAHGDAHGQALERSGLSDLAALAHEGAEAPPACTSCHGAHGMLGPSHARFDQDMVDRCAECHADAAATYFGTYHGKATAVGSEIVATCDHCHGSHRIFPSTEAASLVSEGMLVETCGACHEYARPAFVEYDSHPDPMDRSRNPVLFYSFVFMNVLLFGTLAVFGLHTLLWWVRLTIDRSRVRESSGGESAHGGGGNA